MRLSVVNIFWLGLISVFLSSCCQCRGDEPHFTSEERLEVPASGYDSLRFISNNSDTIYNKIQTNFFTIKPKCSGPSCCICPEDYIEFGNFEQLVENNYYHFFQVQISKDEKNFTKTYSLRDYTFTRFDSTIQNFNIGGVNYPLVYCKVINPSNFNFIDNSLNELYFVKDIGLIKYKYANGEIWELK